MAGFTLFRIFFGLALLTKYSAVFILPIVFVAGLSLIKSEQLRKMLIGLTGIAVIGWVMVWLFYLPFGAPQMMWEELTVVQETISVRRSETVDFFISIAPLPYYYRYGLRLINHHEAVGQLQYLAGRVGRFNWWWFYPLTFMLKTAEMYLVLFLISVYLIFKKKIGNSRLNFLLVTVGSYLLLTANSRMAFGIRILLPIIGFGAVLIAASAVKIKNKQLIQMLMIFYVLLSIVRFPYFFSSANFFSLVFGSKHEVMIDANLDWGQDLKRLSGWCEERGIDSLAVMAHSSLPIDIWGVEGLPAGQAFEQASKLAVSSSLYNLPLTVETEEGEVIARPAEFLQYYLIEDKIGSILIFDLSKSR